MLNDDIDDDYGDEFSDEIDGDLVQATQTLEERRRLHEAFEEFEKAGSDERQPYTILNGKQVHDLGVCRHADVEQVVGDWILGQMTSNQHNRRVLMTFPIHVFRKNKLRYVYIINDIQSDKQHVIVVCEKVTIPAGVIHEALLDYKLVGFRFVRATPDQEQGT